MNRWMKLKFDTANRIFAETRELRIRSAQEELEHALREDHQKGRVPRTSHAETEEILYNLGFVKFRLCIAPGKSKHSSKAVVVYRRE